MTGVVLWNWYLYAYGIAFLACFTGAKAIMPPFASSSDENTGYIKLLNIQGLLLLFALVNLEIADTFSPPGANIQFFSFGNSLSCDLAYSIAWGLFGLGLLILGMSKRIFALRIAGLCLLGITLLKLFCYDLTALQQLFRIAALVVLSAVILLASLLYQKFVATAHNTPNTSPEEKKDNLTSQE